MPLYTAIDGTMKEIGKLFTGVDGNAKETDALYAGVNGAAKEIFVSGYRWRKYAVSSAPSFEYVTTAKSSYTAYSSGYTMIMYAESPDKLTWQNNDAASGTVSFGTKNCDSAQVPYIYNYVSDYVGFYVPLKNDYTLKVYNNTNANSQLTSCGYVLKITGKYYDSSTSTSYLTGEVYSPVMQIGEYAGIVNSKNPGDYPLNGYQDGYWYIYDGEVRWAKHSVNEIFEPSTYSSEESFSSIQSYPILMASQAKKDSKGNVDWGTTYSASSASNLRSNYSTYPYCSFSGTLNADSLYMITTASVLNNKRKKVSGWSKTAESAGEYVGDVVGKLGDYPENGAQDGYWYIQQLTI